MYNLVKKLFAAAALFILIAVSTGNVFAAEYDVTLNDKETILNFINNNKKAYYMTSKTLFKDSQYLTEYFKTGELKGGETPSKYGVQCSGNFLKPEFIRSMQLRKTNEITPYSVRVKKSNHTTEKNYKVRYQILFTAENDDTRRCDVYFNNYSADLLAFISRTIKNDGQTIDDNFYAEEIASSFKDADIKAELKGKLDAFSLK
ncbi:hypothetical protein Dip518_000142 [Parelusimicrobium proximum]|uniref:hypothetical protein n=1 Tax=Parelusimicrobium proximum TaxID=3228953 RepID=UPI003D17873F